MSEAPVAIVGAGLAGLACAVHLHAAGVPVRVFEASDEVGGRVRTDVLDGFRIDRGFQVLTTSYPEAERMLDLDPVGAPVLVLDGEQHGPVNHLCVPSAVQPSYAPAGRALVSASVVGAAEASDAALERAVRAQLAGWFGGAVQGWRLLRVDRIAKALPRQPVGWLEPVERPVQVAARTFVCGDHRDLASLHGAMRSGRRAARAVVQALGVDDERLRGAAA